MYNFLDFFYGTSLPGGPSPPTTADAALFGSPHNGIEQNGNSQTRNILTLKKPKPACWNFRKEENNAM
jgi:hypothetical protein